MTPEQRTANRLRQQRWREANNNEATRKKRAASQRRAYWKRKSKSAGTETVKEKTTLKQRTLRPETLRKKARSEKEQLAALVTMQHYKGLLSSKDSTLRRIGIAWFRVCMSCDNPYAVLQIFHPEPDKLLMELSGIPPNWRFHRSDLTKNYHPIV
jgi:RNA polymerase-binding transcription factor DksA